VHAVAYHHKPDEAGDEKFSSLTAVHVADAMISEQDPSTVNHDAALDFSYLSHLGVRDKEGAWRDLYKNPIAQAGGNAGTTVM
jgi:hypothetical protein